MLYKCWSDFVPSTPLRAFHDGESEAVSGGQEAAGGPFILNAISRFPETFV